MPFNSQNSISIFINCHSILVINFKIWNLVWQYSIAISISRNRLFNSNINNIDNIIVNITQYYSIPIYIAQLWLVYTIAIEKLLLLLISGTIAIAIGIAKRVSELLLLVLLLLRGLPKLFFLVSTPSLRRTPLYSYALGYVVLFWGGIVLSPRISLPRILS